MTGRQYQDAAGRLPYRNRSLNTSSVQPVAHTPTSRTPSPTPTSILTSSPTISNPSQSPTPPQTPGPVPPGTAASGSSSANIKDKPFPRPPVSKWSFKSFSSFGSEKIKDHNLPSWKPFTLRLPYLIFLILLTLFFIISIELLFRKSQRDGYLTFAQGDGLNGWQIFVSQYMGTVASVIFAILLSLSDLDAKRLEPWFELSKPDGVTAKNSILLCYPFDFLAFVPFKAAKRGHWSVFHIGTATVLVFWFITPLQSSLIATVQQQIVLPATFMTTKSLKKLSGFGPEISSFTNVAYSMSWLNSTAPAYSTRSEAVLPFEPSSISGSDLPNTLWTSNSTAYYSKVDCRPAERIIIRDQDRPTGAEVQDSERFFYDRQTNCSFRHAGFPKLYKPGPDQPWRQWYAQFVGYNAGEKVQYYLKTPTCMIPEDPEPSLFFVVFSHQRDYNATPTVAAVFCEPKYQRSPVEAVVDARTRLMKNITYIGPSQELAPDLFNATIFETVVSGGGVGLDATNGGPFNLAPQHTTKTKEINDLLINSDWVFESNALGYLFAIDSNLENYLNVDFLTKTIDKAYKLLFTTYAATKLMVPEDRYVDGSGRVSFTTEVVVVPKVFVRILESLLSAVALFLTCFLISSTRRRTGLVYDPASLAGTMALVASEPKLLEKFAALDGVSTAEKLYQAVGDEKLKFKLNTRSEQYQLTVLPAPGNASPSVGRAARKDENEQETNFELGAAAGTTFILLLGGLLGFIAYIFHYSTTNEGNHLPRRFICVLQPLETLRHGHATASESLTLKFESVPPILTLFPAFKSKHYFLSILAATALSTNILAIALGALFDPDTVLSPTPVEYTDSFLPSIEALPFPWDSSIIDNASIPVNYFAVGRYDHYYKLYANLTTNTPLPSWTTLNHFFLPVKPSSTRLSNPSDLLKVETIGLNANLSCETIEVPLSSKSNLVKLHVEATAFENSGPLFVSALPKNTSIDESSRVFSGGVTETQLLETIRRFLQSDLDTNKYGILSDRWLRFNRDSLPSGWIDFMIQQISNSTKAFDPQAPFQDVDMSFVGEQLSESYSRVFAAILGIYYEQMFVRAPDSTSRFQGTKLIPTIRMQMSTAMFAIVASLLGWYFLLAIHFYIFRVSRLFQRLPTSIASEIQLFHKSSVLDDVRGTELLTSRQREDYLSKLNQRYGYGRFMGKDGVQRIGIEREPLLDHMSNQEVRNQGLGKIGLTIEYWIQWAKRTLT
ncbi:hypothetical protein TWF191_005053 [Orbilia oligospora]|uniref:Uncharacterized protein n=1 Tax=Orbilia oligospora TaxID=2813651 RepID=A0A7C8Q5G1_ORBOL|nr:hypothetical protein TWF191_005053 [Orbilia oligospora]